MSFTTQVTNLEERPQPKLWLAKPDFTIIERLNGVENLNGKFNYMNQSEISFDVNSHLYDEFENKEYKNPAIHLIKNKYLIKFTYNNQTEWFVIDDRADVSEDKEYVPVTARYIGSELDKKWIGDIEEIGVTVGSLFNKYLPIVAPNWKLRSVDPKIASIKREYTTSDASISSLIEMACDLTDAVVTFHNRDREFSLVHRDNAGQFKGLKIKESTYLKGFNDASDSKNLTTRLVPFGKEGLTINSVNPAGTSYIEDFSYYMRPFKRDSNRNVIQHSDYMSDALCHALLDFEEYFEGKREEYEGVTEEYSALLAEELEEEFKLTEVSSILQRLEDRIEVLKPQDKYVEKRIMGNTSFNLDYNTYYYLILKNQGSTAKITFNGEEALVAPNEYHYIKIKTPEKETPDDEELVYDLKVLAANTNLVGALSTSSEEDFKEEDILEIDKKYNIYKYQELYDYQVSVVAAVERRLKQYENQRESINNSLDVNTFFPPSLVEERENFVSWGVWREENHTEPKELLEDALKQLKESNNVERTTDLTVVDFLQSLEDKENWDKLSAGDKIRFSNETYEKQYEAFISELNINFDEHDITVTVSDVIDLKQRGLGISQKLASFVSTSNQVSLHGKQIGETMGKANEVMALLEGEWDANARRITAANETVTIDNRGLIIQSPTHPNEMLVAVAGLIAISNDNGETFKQAINTRGVVAERLIGKVLIGTELIMENDSGTFRFDNDGVRINAANFHLLADDGENYFDKLMAQMQQEVVTFEESLKEEIENQKESLQGEISDVEGALTNYTTELINALADGFLTKQEIHALQLRLNLLESEYAQVRRRIMPIVNDRVVDPETQLTLFTTFTEFEEDYEKLIAFIEALDAPTEIPQETIDAISALMERFRPNLENLLLLIDASLEEAQENRIANAEYNTRQFSERLVADLNNEVVDLKDSLGDLDAVMEEALSDGILTTAEKARLRDALLRLRSEKEDVDNRFGITYGHAHLEGTAEKSALASQKNAYNSAYNSLITKVNQILSLETVTHNIIQEYETLYDAFTDAVVAYSESYEKAVEKLQKGYADTAEGEAKKYADGLKAEVQADVKDVQDNIKDFQFDVYGAFKDGIITDQERNRLGVHHDMLEKEKSDVIERYDTIITSNYLQGFYDTEKLVRTRSEYGSVHADLLLAIELAMMDSKITKQESEEATALFEQYTIKLTAFSVELELAIAAIGEAKAVAFTNEELKNYIELSVFNDEIAQMQATLDGHITTHYYDHTPTLSNLPASEWATAKDKDNHVGDLFYNSADGFAYRFMKEGSVYKWVVIKDSEVTKALKDAEDALDLADKKRRVFVTTPTAPYDIGDLWIKDDGELMRARTEKGAGGTFSEIDWVIATKYTDDTRANQVGNQLTDYMSSNNAEIKDLRETLGAFQKTVNGTFKDGIIAEYELKILKTQMQALDREKADVDSGYNQLLAHPNLSGTPKTQLQNAYTDFAETHNNLTAKINQVIEDGVITDTEYEDTMALLDSYPIKLTTYKTVMNDTYLMLIEQAKKAADDALDGVGRYDEWKSSYFTTDVEGIASRVGESSWETTWKPQVGQAIDSIEIGSVNLANWTDVNSINRGRMRLVGAAEEVQIVTLDGEDFYQVRGFGTSDSGYGNLGAYIGRVDSSENSYFSIEKGQAYTLTLRGFHSSTVDDFSYVYIMRDDNMENPESSSSGVNQGVSRALMDRVSVDTGYGMRYRFTFTADWSSREAYLLIGTGKKSGFNTPDTSFWYRFKEVQLEKGNKSTDWKLSQPDQDERLDSSIDNFYTDIIKAEYSTTTQTKNLLGSYVTNLEMQGNLDKIATYAQAYDYSGNPIWLREANGSTFSDNFSYEITAKTRGTNSTLLVVVLNTKGQGKGWDLEVIEEKGTTAWHPKISLAGSVAVIDTHGGTGDFTIDVVYTKYAGAFTNLSKTKSLIEQKADEIEMGVSRKIDSPSRNLIPHSTLPEENDMWSGFNSNTSITSAYDYMWVYDYTGGSNNSMAVQSSILPMEIRSGQKYTLSFKSARIQNVYDDMRYCYLLNENGSNYFISTTKIKREFLGQDYRGQDLYYYTATFEPDFSGKARVLIGTRTITTANSIFYLKEPQLEMGEIATPYDPAPTDLLEASAQFKITADNISSEVKKKVGDSEIISKINQSAEKISIDASKISLTAGSPIDEAIQNNSHPNPNIIPMSNFWNYPSHLFYENHSLSVVNASESGIFKSPEFGRGWVKLMNSTLDTASGLTYMWTQSGGRNRFSITANQEYTFSILVAQNFHSTQMDYCYIRDVTSGTSQINLATSSSVKRTRYLVGETYGRHVYKYVFTFTPSFGGTNSYMFFGLSNLSESRNGYYLSEWKLEAGEHASPYSEDFASKDYIIAAINMDKSGTRISGDKVSITANDIEIDGRTIDISSNSSVETLTQKVGQAQGAADTADSRARAARNQADAAREGNNIVASLNLSGTTANISGSKINLVGDVSMVSGNTRITNLDFNRATATGGSGSDTLKLSGDTIELEGRYARTWRGVTRTEDVFTRMRHGHLRFRNDSQNRSLYYSDFGISTYVDGEGDGDASGTLSFFDHTYSTARGITMHSTHGVAALKSENNRVILEAGGGSYIYAVAERLRVIRNADRTDSYSEIQFSDGLANSIRVTDDRADFYIGVSTNELRVTNNLRYNSGNIGWQPVHCATLKTESAMVTESHSGVNAYFGVGTQKMRVTDNNGYNGGSTGYREIDAADFNNASSEKFKKDITEWNYPVLDILKDEVKLYKYKLKADDDTENSMFRRGVILERETPPEWISGDTVKSYEMISWAIKGIQELAHENDELKEELSETKKKNQELEARLEKIEEMLLNQ